MLKLAIIPSTMTKVVKPNSFVSFQKMMKYSKSYIFTSQDLSWLQNGQLNCVSNGSLFFFGSAFLLDLLLPILI